MANVEIGRCGVFGNVVGVVAGRFRLGRFRVRLRIALVALQQRIALQLAFDIGLELEVRQLQKLDRLLQLGRDDEALALPKLESWTKRQRATPKEPNSLGDTGPTASDWLMLARFLQGRGNTPQSKRSPR